MGSITFSHVTSDGLVQPWKEFPNFTCLLGMWSEMALKNLDFKLSQIESTSVSIRTSIRQIEQQHFIHTHEITF